MKKTNKKKQDKTNIEQKLIECKIIHNSLPFQETQALRTFCQLHPNLHLRTLHPIWPPHSCWRYERHCFLQTQPWSSWVGSRSTAASLLTCWGFCSWRWAVVREWASPRCSLGGCWRDGDYMWCVCVCVVWGRVVCVGMCASVWKIILYQMNWTCDWYRRAEICHDISKYICRDGCRWWNWSQCYSTYYGYLQLTTTTLASSPSSP